MNINEFIDHLYWISKFGRPKRKISSESLFSNPERLENPIFFLSTGRCGTEWFTHLIKKNSESVVFHNPAPNFSVQNKFMYNLISGSNENANAIGKQLLFAGRESYFKYAYKAKKRYVETNNHITFFANSLAETFPSAKFVHLYRHPGDFVTSGLNRGWFGHNEDATEKLISPLNPTDWKNYSELEKIAWVWNETNEFIETFKSKNPNRVQTFDFSRRDPIKLQELLNNLDLPIPIGFIQKSLKMKRNVQKKLRHPRYREWEESDKKKLQIICGKLSEKYEFQL